MSETPKPQIGTIGWFDLTVPDAGAVKDFYTQVVGWQADPHDMGDYHDFDIKAPDTGETVTGICHARGSNANIPPQWIIYITVENVPEAAQRVIDLGGKIVDGPRDLGGMEFCLIQDPAGAVAALISY